jgi:hypothetical protein
MRWPCRTPALARRYKVFLCDYLEGLTSRPMWDAGKGLVNLNRTELCDATHDLFTGPTLLTIPRRSGEVEPFAKVASNIAEVPLEDPETGSKVYRYRKLGDDHYRHTLNYFYLAASKIGVSSEYYDRWPRQEVAETDFDPYGD